MADGLGTAGGVVSAVDHRLNQAGLIAPQTSSLAVRTGVMVGPGSTALVTGTSATGTMTVSIAAHHWVTTRGTADGVYLGTKEAAGTVNIAAAPGANSRIDVVYVKQNDAGSSISPDGSTGEVYGVVTGTAAVAPPKPSIPVGAIELATVQVAAGATSTNGAGVTITNTAQQTVTRGVPVPVRTQAERDALTTFVGLSVKRLDRGGSEERWTGTEWDGPAVPMSGEYTASNASVGSGAVAGLGTITKARESGGLNATLAADKITLPAGLWVIEWGATLSATTISGRNFLQIAGPGLQQRHPWGSIGEDAAGTAFLIPLTAATQLTFQHLTTASAGTFTITHAVRVARIGGF